MIMDADAWLISEASTIVLSVASWTATINGKVTSSNFSGAGNVAIYLYATAIPHSITIGQTAEITGYTAGIWAEAGNSWRHVLQVCRGCPAQRFSLNHLSVLTVWRRCAIRHVTA